MYVLNNCIKTKYLFNLSIFCLIINIKKIAPKIVSQLKMLENKLDPEDFKNVMYGTIETWLLWSITKEKTHATDMTCASTTGMYDSYCVRFIINMYIFCDIDKSSK